MTKYWIGGAIIVAVLGLYFVLDRARSSPADTVAIDFGISGDATITELPPESVVPQPSLDRPITFAAGTLPPEAQAIIRTRLESAVASLKKDPSDLSSWILLGVYRKQAVDYEGARQAWVYVNTLAPTDEVSAVNLADLYMNFIKDYPKAELYYRKAIANDPHNIDNYRNLYTLYSYLYKTGTSAETDIIKEGLRNNPGNPDLEVLLAADTASRP
jgi:tetratricopeptide (TPR) repeat protein